MLPEKEFNPIQATQTDYVSASQANKLPGGSCTRVHACMRSSIKCLHNNGALLRIKLLHNSKKEKKNQWDGEAQRLQVYQFLNVCSWYLIAPFFRANSPQLLTESQIFA